MGKGSWWGVGFRLYTSGKDILNYFGKVEGINATFESVGYFENEVLTIFVHILTLKGFNFFF